MRNGIPGIQPGAASEPLAIAPVGAQPSRVTGRGGTLFQIARGLLLMPIIPALLSVLALAGPARAQSADPSETQSTTRQRLSPGTRIEGRVLDAGTGKPLAVANIVVSGTRIGTISQDDGSFFIETVAPGRQTIVVTFMGYAPAEESVDLAPGRTVRMTFRLSRAIAGMIDPIEIHAERPVIDVTKTSTSHTLSAQDLQSLVTQAPTIDAVVAQQPGVVSDRGRLHFRGGRADENLFVVDGVKVKDLLSGRSSGSEVASRAAQEVNVITGGFEARFSQAMSGVIDTRLKEGTRSWHGAMSYESDALTDSKNLHHLYFEVSGPELLISRLLETFGARQRAVTFFASLSGDFSDGYLPSVRDLPGNKKLRSSFEDQFLGAEFRYGEFFCPRASNRWRAIFKSAWRVNASNKLTVSLTKTLAFQQDWGAPDIGDIDRNANRFPWSWDLRMDHHYTITADTNILSLIWNRTLGLNTRTSLQAWRHYSGKHSDVAGKLWYEYDYRSRDYELPWEEDTPYFVDTGDAPLWSDQHVIVWGLKNDWQYATGRHAFSWGLSAEYHEVQYFRMNTRSIDKDHPLGTEFDLFHVTPNAGNLYLQDLFRYEGLSANLGLVYDYWFPGKQVENALEKGVQPHMTPELRRKYYDETKEFAGLRFKDHISPRLGVSFPISEQAHLFFSYGHYSQRPPYYYVYAKTSSQSGEEYPIIGNPTLNPEISVQYEIGSGYQFSEAAAAKLTLFWKDMYDYPTSTRIIMTGRTTKRSNFFIFWNMDYARSRGIEASLLRKRSNYWSGSLSYTYSIAKGKSSDPNKTKLIQEMGGDSRETGLGEEYLWWNRPHKLTMRVSLLVKEHENPPHWLGFRWPGDLSANLYFMIRSGRAYTPINELNEKTGDPLSNNGPYDSTCDLVIRKGFHVGRQRIEAAFEVYNLFDYRTPLEFDRVTGKGYEMGKGSLDSVLENPDNLNLSDEELIDAYYMETGKQEDAPGLRKEIVANTYRYSNPAYRGQPRAIRIGLNYEW